MLVAGLICAVVILGIGLMALFGSTEAETDSARLTRYLDERNASLLRMEPLWVPGEPVAYHKIGRKGGYVYSIIYLDSEDRCHFAECETNAAIGVILRRDGIRAQDVEAE